MPTQAAEAMPHTDPPAEGAASSPAIAVAGLTHRYRPITRRHTPRPALDDLSLEVARGESVAILGPNGGGKTTLFRILATVLRPDAGDAGPAAGARSRDTTEAAGGSVRIMGLDPASQARAIRRQIGVVFQSPSLDGKLTAAENLRHHGHLYGLGGADLSRRIETWLERFNLAERRDERVERFSGGMRRRVELAKALLHEPALLLMDEPATGLDPAARRDLWHHLETLRAERGVTLALTTHLTDEAERCRRVGILDRGRLLAMDEPAELKDRVGGEVITLEPAEGADNTPHALAGFIEERFGPFAAASRPTVIEGIVHFEMIGATEMVAELTYELPGRIRRITVGQPTLEDVFLHVTGERFEG